MYYVFSTCIYLPSSRATVGSFKAVVVCNYAYILSCQIIHTKIYYWIYNLYWTILLYYRLVLGLTSLRDTLWANWSGIANLLLSSLMDGRISRNFRWNSYILKNHISLAMETHINFKGWHIPWAWRTSTYMYVVIQQLNKYNGNRIYFKFYLRLTVLLHCYEY